VSGSSSCIATLYPANSQICSDKRLKNFVWDPIKSFSNIIRSSLHTVAAPKPTLHIKSLEKLHSNVNMHLNNVCNKTVSNKSVTEVVVNAEKLIRLSWFNFPVAVLRNYKIAHLDSA